MTKLGDEREMLIADYTLVKRAYGAQKEYLPAMWRGGNPIG